MIFKDKTVVITGGSEGVGAAAARMFAEAGANLMLVARSKRNLEAMAEELRDKTRVEVFAMDVSDDGACVDLFKKTEFEFGHIDILVNNAGYHQRGLAAEVGVADLGKMVDVNLKAPIILSRTALPYLREAGGGAIITVGSLAGRTPVPGSATYAATKAGLRSFTYSMFEELRGSGIKIATVSPGPIDTGVIMSDGDVVADLTFSQPISTAEQVAQAILDLCGNDQREKSMPAISGLLTMLTYIMPGLARAFRPMLERNGARVKRQLRAAQKSTTSD
mgnify:FL=1